MIGISVFDLVRYFENNEGGNVDGFFSPLKMNTKERKSRRRRFEIRKSLGRENDGKEGRSGRKSSVRIPHGVTEAWCA